MSCKQEHVFALMTYHQRLKRSFRLYFRKNKLNFFFSGRAVQSRQSVLVRVRLTRIRFVLSLLSGFIRCYERSCVFCKKASSYKEGMGKTISVFDSSLFWGRLRCFNTKRARKLLISLNLNMHSQIDRLFSYLKAHLLIGKKNAVYLFWTIYMMDQKNTILVLVTSFWGWSRYLI